MIVDSSALIAVLRLESDWRAFANSLDNASYLAIPTPIYLETCMVIAVKKGPEGIDDLDALILRLNIELLPFSGAAAATAVSAFLKYGKGRGHKAQLNFGDCISYAMSKTELMPLLFKGDDFRHTDVEAAL